MRLELEMLGERAEAWAVRPRVEMWAEWRHGARMTNGKDWREREGVGVSVARLPEMASEFSAGNVDAWAESTRHEEILIETNAGTPLLHDFFLREHRSE